MRRTIACIAVLCGLTSVAAQAATPNQKAALAALVAGERAHGTTDIEGPSCSVLQTWAQCVFMTAQGNLSAYAWLHEKNGKWIYLGGESGSPVDYYMKKYGFPAPIAKQFQTQCKC